MIRGNDAGLVFIDDREAMGKVEGITGIEERSNFGPHEHLTGIGDEILDDRPALGSLGEGEKGITRYPAVVEGFLPVG